LILDNSLETALAAVTDTTSHYAFKTLILNPNSGIDTSIYSVIVADQDGKVVLDTAKLDAQNTFNRCKENQINENLNTRVDVMEAQMFPEGTGFSTTQSGITDTYQANVAIRLGKWRNSAGTIRISKNFS